MNYEYKDGVSVEDCPFCASSWGPPQPEQHAASGRWSVGCMNAHCGANSGWCDTEAEAIALWNKRPNAIAHWLVEAEGKSGDRRERGRPKG